MNADAGTWGDDGAQNNRDLVMQVVCWALVAIAAPQLFVPVVSPVVLAAIGLAPWALLLMVFLGNGRYLLFGPKGHSVVVGAVFVPLILGMGALLQYNLVDWQGPATWTVGMAVGFTLLAKMADSSAVAARPDTVTDAGRRSWPLVLIAGAFLGWATTVNLNASAAGLPDDVHSETVVRKWVSGGKSHTAYVNFASPPALGITNFVVPMALYRQSAPGDRLCLVIRTGALGWRWYNVKGRDACGDPVWGKQPG